MSYWTAFARKYPDRPFLKLDGGSIFNARLAEAPILNKWTLEGTFKSNLDALNLSAWDLPIWQEMADLAAAGAIPGEFLKVPLVSANAAPRSGNFPAVQRYVIKDLGLAGGGSLRVGITGLLSDPEGRISSSEFEIQNPQEAARKVIAEMEGSTDYRVVMTDLNLGKAISLAIVVPKINLILVAHNYEAVSEPQEVGETLIVIPVNEGRMVSEVRIARDATTSRVEARPRFVPLDRTVPDDPEMGELVRKAQSELEGFRNGRVPGNLE